MQQTIINKKKQKGNKMKTLKLLAIVTIFLSAAIYSQPKLSIGIHAGLNFASASVTPSQTMGGRTGIIIGGLADIELSKQFSVVPGIQYISKGASTSESGYTSTTSLNYFEIPVLAQYKFSLSEFKPYFFAGPNFAINLSANSEQSGGGGSASEDVSSSLGSFDMGLMFGTGTEYKITPGMDLYLNLGYSVGLSNISKDNSASVKNNGLRVIAGIKFAL
jgi:Outer membrane protein beta-barrel domain